jgi:hypothetical protein
LQSSSSFCMYYKLRWLQTHRKTQEDYWIFALFSYCSLKRKDALTIQQKSRTDDTGTICWNHGWIMQTHGNYVLCEWHTYTNTNLLDQSHTSYCNRTSHIPMIWRTALNSVVINVVLLSGSKHEKLDVASLTDKFYSNRGKWKETQSLTYEYYI